MSTGLLDCLLNTQSKTAIPAGQKMQVVMIDRGQLHRNPDNRIYIIGDVSRLKEDIRANGIRQPLEVVELPFGGYKLIGGERRLTACEELAKEGVEGFDMLPCVIRESKDADDDKIALITANATARDLTDGERLAQYEALKEVLTRKKRFGQLQGKVRDELCRILGLSTGAAARLNAIAENCDENVKHQLRDGEMTLMGAYRYAQAVIADKTADIKMPETVRENPQLFEPKEDTPETLPKPPVENNKFEPIAEKKSASETYIQHCDYSGSHKCENSTGLRHFVKHGEIHNCAGCCPICLRKDTCEYCCSYAKESRVKNACSAESAGPSNARDRSTLLKLAEKTLNEKGGWIYDRTIWEFKLDFYKKELPDWAYLWRLDDTQRDAVGLAPGEHVRYAIIYKSGDFFTTGWENYSDAVESLIRYLDLK